MKKDGNSSTKTVPPSASNPPNSNVTTTATGGKDKIRTGDWICKKCKINNFASRDVCFNCGGVYDPDRRATKDLVMPLSAAGAPGVGVGVSVDVEGVDGVGGVGGVGDVGGRGVGGRGVGGRGVGGRSGLLDMP